MVLLAAFQLLLGRIAGQEDVAVGSPVANRTRTETEGRIGLFINTLVLRTRLAGEESFHALLQRVREVVLGGYSHQDLPFDRLVQELRPDRDSSPSPFFQVFFDFQLEGGPTTGPQLELPGVRLRPYPIGMDTTQFALSLSLIDGGKGLSATLGYDVDLFDRATIRRLAEHFERLLGGAVRAPETGIWDLPLLGEGERHQLVREWNDTAAAGHEGLCVHELFALQAARSAERPAVVLDGEELSYGELEERAAELARRLERRGVGAEVRVGLCVERSFEMVVGLLAVLKAGGCYVPLDPGYPSERLAYMVADSGISLVLAQERTRGRLPEAAGLEVLALDAPPAAAAEAGVRPRLCALPDNPAYVIYTSGSTGRPKGVVVPHRALAGYVRDAAEAYDIEPVDRVLQFASLSFDASAEEIYPCLARGAALVLRTEEMTSSMAGFCADVDRLRISVLDLPTSFWHELAVALTAAEVKIPSSVRLVILGGEKVDADRVAAWHRQAPAGVRLVNTYGPTEATVVALRRALHAAEHLGEIPIGRPISGARAWGLDRHLDPVPVGSCGELFLGGSGLARAYLNRPDLTAERFVPDPFSGTPGARLYRTADLVRACPNGELLFLGRSDFQLKIRGFRIEPGEIEAALRRHEKVSEAVAAARIDSRGRPYLVAFVVPSAGEAPRMAELREFLTDRLPGHMVPSAFVVLSELPLTANGKVDRKALPAPAGERVDDGSAYVAPRTPLEEQLAQIWAEVLGLEKVGVHDNFFELGGDSILCLQVASRAKRAGLKKVSSRLMFQHPTVAGLLAVAGVGEGPVAVGDVAPSGGSLPLLPIQHWFFAQEPAEPHHFNQAVLLELRGDLSPQRLELALRGLERDHEALRLRFERDAAGGWRQAVSSSSSELARLDLSALAPAAQRRALAAAAGEVQRGLDLERGPVWRASWFLLGGQGADRLLLVVHHLAVDGVSWRILLEELSVQYECLESGLELEALPEPTPLRRWAERLLAHARSPELESEAAYWLAERPVGVRPLPLDLDSGEDAVGWERSVSASLEGEETRVLLQELTRAYRAQMDEGLLSALARSLAEWTSERWLLVDLEGHGREPEGLGEDLDLSRTVGWLTSQYPVLLELEGGWGAEEALRSVRDQLERVPRRGLGYGVLRYLGSSELSLRRLGALPAAQVGFNYLGQVGSLDGSGGGEAGSPCREKRWARRAAPGDAGSIFWRPLPWSPGGVCSCVYCPTARGVIGEETASASGLMQRWVEGLRELVAACRSAAPSYAPADFPMARLSSRQLGKILQKVGKGGGV